MIDPATRPLNEGEIRMPDGNILTKESAKEFLVKGVADEFRRARKEGAYQTSDWIRFASEKVVEKLFELDAYFEQMLEINKQLAKAAKSWKPGVREVAKKIINVKSDEQKS